MKINVYGIPSEKVVAWLLEKDSGINTWVDLGCGNGEYLNSINFKPKKGIAVDLVPPGKLRSDFVFERREINEWLDNNQSERFELISIFDVVEHFKKEEAITLINKSQNLAKNLIIGTPSGFIKQNAETHPAEKDNPWQWHRCGFDPAEFEKLGFLVFVLKNYHYKPIGNDRSFDKLVCFWSKDQEMSYGSIGRFVRFKTFCYLLWPLHFFRMMRDTLVKPLL